jgi:hypothetical protein
MTKLQVLEVVSSHNDFVFPDTIWKEMPGCPLRVSVYSFLARLFQQGLLERARKDGRIAYLVSARGRKRLNYLRQTQVPN